MTGAALDSSHVIRKNNRETCNSGISQSIQESAFNETRIQLKISGLLIMWEGIISHIIGFIVGWEALYIIIYSKQEIRPNLWLEPAV